MKKAFGVAALALLAAAGLSACDNGQCKAEGIQIERTVVSVPIVPHVPVPVVPHIVEPPVIVPHVVMPPVIPFIGGGHSSTQCKGASK